MKAFKRRVSTGLKNLRKKSCKRGFSLIEIMIVVAIIGFLTAMALPSFLRFQSKAKQSAAKTQLGALYLAQKAFHAEWSTFFSDFRDIGYAPEGTMTYRIIAGGATPTITRSPRYTFGGGACGSVATGAACTPVQFDTTVYCASSGAGSCDEDSTADATANIPEISNAGDFLAGAGANIDGDTTIDEWSIDEGRDLVNVTSDL